MNWLNTIRWKNLVIVAISILVIILPYFNLILKFQLFNEFLYWILICCSIAAIGNITNDWLDVKQDKENKKKNVFIDPKNKRIAVILISLLLLITAVSLFLSYNRNIFLQLSIAALVLLLLYNLAFKKIALLGNLIVAVLTALIFLGIDIIVLNRIVYYEIGIRNMRIELLASFALLTTLIREILKDAEDRKGDVFAGFYTIARFLTDKWIAGLIMVLAILGCIGIYFLMQWRQTNYLYEFLFYSAWIVSISILAGVFMLTNNPSKYVRATRFVKVGMLGCLVIYLVLSF